MPALGFAKGEARMNKKTLIGLGLSVALTGAVAAPAITVAPAAAYAEDAYVEVSTADELQTALNEGKNVKLTADITKDIEVKEGVAAKIDLNGRTLDGYVDVYGNLTVLDSTAKQPTVNGTTVSGYVGGKITCSKGDPVLVKQGGVFTLESGSVQTPKGSAIWVRGNRNPQGSSDVAPIASTVNINGGYVVAYGSDYVIGVEARGAVLNANDGIVESADGVVLGGNGTDNTSRYCGGTTINVTGGTYVGHVKTSGDLACGVYQPQSGTLNISGGDFIIENGVGVLMRGGDLNMTGGTITTAGNATGTVGDSNVISSCYGVFVDPSANYPSAKEAGVSASVAGGTIETDGANADSIAQSSSDGTAVKSVSTSVTGGTFENLSNFISASKFMPEGYAVVTEDGEAFTVTSTAAAKRESSVHKTYEFTQGKETAIYFTGDNAQETAGGFVGGNSESGDTAKKAPLDKVKVDISYLDTNDGELADATLRPITADEYNNTKLTLDLTKLPEVSKPGYVFAGWQARLSDDADELEDLTGDSAAVEFDEALLTQLDNEDGVTLTVNFYASWYNDHVTLKLDTAGGATLDDIDLAVDSDGTATLKKSEISTPTRDGYTFAGWVMDEYDEDTDATVAKAVAFPKTFGATRNPEKVDTYTLRATWVKNGVVKFDSNGGSAVEDMELATDATSGEAFFSYGQLKNKVPTREGYTFVGWEDVDKKLDGTKNGAWKNGVVFGGESDDDAAAVFAVTEDDCVVTLKAVWKKIESETPATPTTPTDPTTNVSKTTTTTTASAQAAKAKVLPATGDNSAAAVAGIAATGAALVAAAATKRRNSDNA